MSLGKWRHHNAAVSPRVRQTESIRQSPSHTMSRQISCALLQSAQQQEGGAWGVSQRVAPLFETLADLDNAGKVMRRLFNVPWYREQLR